MADGWDPERLGEPGQRPAPRLSPSLLLLFLHLSCLFNDDVQFGTLYRLSLKIREMTRRDAMRKQSCLKVSVRRLKNLSSTTSSLVMRSANGAFVIHASN